MSRGHHGTPKNIRLAAFLIGFGMTWAMAKTLQYLLTVEYMSFGGLWLWKGVTLLSLLSIREILYPKLLVIGSEYPLVMATIAKNLIFQEGFFLDENKISSGKSQHLVLLTTPRHLALLLFVASIWFVHGFAYYGIGHSWVNDNAHEVNREWVNLKFANITDAFIKLITALFCLKRGKTVRPFAVLFAFTGLLFLAMPIIQLPHAFGRVSVLYQMASTVNVGSWNILWFITPLTFPARVR